MSKLDGEAMFFSCLNVSKGTPVIYDWLDPFGENTWTLLEMALCIIVNAKNIEKQNDMASIKLAAK